jgi:CRISPR type III-B/RAMP module RAMP protein Cmr6
MNDQYYLPTGTATILNDYIDKCQNLALILDKYIPQHVVVETKNKGPWLQSLIRRGHIDTALIRSAYSRWNAMISAMHVEPFYASLDWRMVIGLGGETVLETDLTLHHLYGIPFIPGSALKGLTRAYVAQEYKKYYIPEKMPEEQRKPSTKTDDDHSEIKQIFGAQEHAGTVIFFDAMPLNGEVQFVLDIMNPHYPDYYGGSKPPTNDQSPMPVTFLTVTNTTFTFALAPRNPKDLKHQADVETVKEWLREALQSYGIGGKTSAGYGYLKIVKEGKTVSSSKSEEKVWQPKPTERIRPNIPKFREGQEITGSVVIPTDQLRQMAPDAKAFLRYQSFAITDVVIVVRAEEAQNWKSGETRICLFQHEEVRDGCTMLISQPRAKKKK